jgi:pimeloyl-ACP methyl ester carboxylesterase
VTPTLVVAALAAALAAGTPPAYGPELQGFEYTHPAQSWRFESQGESVQMTYLDVKPAAPNGRAVVLLHGKNFCAATWEATIAALAGAGFRVVAPDQIGFCKSSKPVRYQYTFQQLATNTHQLLQKLGIGKAVVAGHSMGGMLAARYALMFPAEVEQLVLVNPIGLEDWKAKGVPYRTVDELYAKELRTTAESLRAYQKSTYFAGQWRAEYDRWVEMLAGMYRGIGKPQVARTAALTSDMIFTQPVVYELGKLRVPTLLLIGTKDTTAIGKDAAPEDVKATLGRYAVLGKEAAKLIPGSRLVEWDDLGHAPHVQDPKRFHEALLRALTAGR